MPKVELIYDADCPNVEAARSQLRLAVAQAGQAPQWNEWERSDPAAPAYVHRYGSPAILVDGRDVGGGAPTDTDSCRPYHGEDGRLHPAPRRRRSPPHRVKQRQRTCRNGGLWAACWLGWP